MNERAVSPRSFIVVFSSLVKLNANICLSGHLITVVAVDGAEKTSEVTVEIDVLDVNDQPPRFVKRKYQGFMNKDLTKLRNDLQVEVSEILGVLFSTNFAKL